MTKKLFAGTTNGLALWVDVLALERLNHDRDIRLKKRQEHGGKPARGPYLRRLVEEGVVALLDGFRLCGDCWIWQGGRNEKGYGMASIVGLPWKAHRLIYFLTTGACAMPPMVCHHCDTPSCGKPEHLFAGNGRMNADDKVRKGRDTNIKLTADQVLEIRRRYVPALNGWLSTPNAGRRLAQEFGVSQRTVWAILRREIWNHLPA